MNNLHILPVGPANHHSIILSGAWSSPAPYNDIGQRFSWAVTDPVPPEATAVLLRVKMKAYVSRGQGKGYCQGNMRFVNADATMNHLIHVEDFSRGEAHLGEARRVTYTTLFAPVRDGKIEFDVAYEIIGRGNIEFNVYVEGYVLPVNADMSA